jgi:peptide/nickel transport system substrate-binding protein
VQCNNNRAVEDISTVTIFTSYWGIINPFNSDTGFFLLYPPLFKWNEKGESVGCLAKKWENSPDYRTWTYTLHDNIKWHDGVPFTTQDVKFTHELLTNPDNPRIPPGARILKIIDDHTFSITFNTWRSYRPREAWNYYLPMHIFEGKSLEEIGDILEAKSQPPIGYGPYRYVRHVANTMMELEANHDYFLGRPKIDRVILKLGGEKFTELQAGNVDIINATGLEAQKIGDDPRFVYYYKASIARALFWNQNRFLFEDVKTRRALTLAIDRRELYRLHNVPDEVPIVDGVYSLWQLHSGELPEALPYDPEQASKLFEEVGWRDQDGDGVLDKDDQRFRFTAIFHQVDLKAATLIQAHYKRLGVQMELQTLAPGALWSKVREGKFDVFFGGGGINNLREILGRARRPSSNKDIGYPGTEMKQILDESENDWAFDLKERTFFKLWEILQRDMPITFLQPFIQGRIVHRRIMGLSSPFRIFPLCHMENLWIEEEM